MGARIQDNRHHHVLYRDTGLRPSLITYVWHSPRLWHRVVRWWLG